MAQGLAELRVVGQGELLQVGQGERPSLRPRDRLRVGAGRRHRREQSLEDLFSFRVVFIFRQLDARQRPARQEGVRDLEAVGRAVGRRFRLVEGRRPGAGVARRLGRRLVGRRQRLQVHRVGRHVADGGVDRVAVGEAAGGRQQQGQRRRQPSTGQRRHRRNLP